MKQIAEKTSDRGMDIDEIRYQRALSLARYEMAKYRFKESVSNVSSEIARPRGIIGKILLSLNYMDYAMLAFRLGSRLIKWRKRRG